MTKQKATEKNREVRIRGVINENTDLEEFTGTLFKNLTINCSAVEYLTSQGVRRWARHFRTLAEGQVKLVFTEISPSMVRHLNIVRALVPPQASIESFLVPYYCGQCRYAFDRVASTRDLSGDTCRAPQSNCPHCRQPASFDDNQEEYFTFLRKLPVCREEPTRTKYF